MSTEEWRPIPGYEDRYKVSDHGRVYSIRSEKVLKPAPVRGYPAVNLYSPGGKGKTMAIHRMVLATFAGPKPDGHVVCHRDGTRTNNKLGNLYWGTPSQNNQDTIRHGNHHKVNKTHCPEGHPYTPENLVKRRKWRDCYICDLARKRRRWRERHPVAGVEQ